MELPCLFKPNLKSLEDHLKQISRERNFETTPKVLREIESYVRDQLISYGYVVDSNPFSASGEIFNNLVARLDSDLTKPRFIIGAHFDSVPGSPGADDNATGVAALLEAAFVYSNLWKEKKVSPNREASCIEFVAFNFEEYGMVGSQAYAEKLKQESIPVVGMLSLEMIGYTSKERGSQKMPFFLKPFYPDVGNFVGLVANTKSKGFMKQIEKIFRDVRELPVECLTLPANGWVFPDARLSDHSPFWDRGFPALLVTDTSFFRNPNYHTEKDTVETIDLDFLGKVTEGVIESASYFTEPQSLQAQMERRYSKE